MTILDRIIIDKIKEISANATLLEEWSHLNLTEDMNSG